MPTTSEQIEFTAPAEPPPGSVVLDRDGRSWQRDPQGDAWRRAGAAALFGIESGCTWAYLVVDRGPLTLVHRAEDVT